MASVTLKHLAAELGLSITTVSRALAGYSDVAEATRRRVCQVPSASTRRPSSNRREPQPSGRAIENPDGHRQGTMRPSRSQL